MPILLATIMLLSVACNDDDDTKSLSKIYDFVTAYTNSAKIVSGIKTDDGKLWTISNYIKTESADSAIRCLCGYVDDNGIMKVYNIMEVFSKYPVRAENFKEHPKDPLKVVSVWCSGGYVNIHLGIMTTNAANHAYAFCQDSIVDHHVYVSLIHQQPEKDAESYTQDTYLSMPLTNYADHDSVTIRINTYDGMFERGWKIE